MSLSVLTTHLTTATNDETCLKTKNAAITGKFAKIQEFAQRTKIQEIQQR